MTIFQAGLFEGQVAVVTGGGTGIGFATASELVTLGADVAICGRRPEPLAEAAEALRGLREGARVHQAPMDIRDYEAVEGWVDGTLEALGKIDILINNAGGQFPTTAQHLSPRGFEAVVRNNLQGTWNVTHAVANKAFLPQKRGRIVNVIAQIARW